MPLVKNTETGNNYLEKTNTGGDTSARNAIRNYDKQLGNESTGDPGNNEYTLPFLYVPDQHVLLVFVNGQKAEYMDTGGDITYQKLEYREPTNNRVEFWYPLEDDDIVEFIVVGGYEGDTNDSLSQDLSQYKTRNDTLTVNGTAPTHFDGPQSMGSAIFTSLGNGATNGDSIRYQQIFDNNVGSFSSGDHIQRHSSLWSSGNNNKIIQVGNTSASFSNVQIKDLAQGTLGTDAVNIDQLRWAGVKLLSPPYKVWTKSYTSFGTVDEILTFNAIAAGVAADADGIIVRVRTEVDKGPPGDSQPIYMYCAIGNNTNFWVSDAQQNTSTEDVINTNDAFVNASNLSAVNSRFRWLNGGNSTIAEGKVDVWVVGYFR